LDTCFVVRDHSGNRPGAGENAKPSDFDDTGGFAVFEERSKVVRLAC